MINKKLIIFDFFGVISSEIAPIWLKKYFEEEEAKKIKKEIVSQVDIGTISEEELYNEIGSLAGVLPETVKSEWMDLVKINSELIDFIKKIKDKYKIVLLSNASETFLKRILNKYKLYDLFDNIIISSKEKLVKPSMEIYNLAINRMNVKPKEALIIDDNIVNIEGAKQAGIEGILYKDFNSFCIEFEKKTSK